jgi:hypothetical protein
MNKDTSNKISPLTPYQKLKVEGKSFPLSYDYYVTETKKRNVIRTKKNDINILDEAKYVKILNDISTELGNELIATGNAVSLPNSFGSFQIVKYKHSKAKMMRLKKLYDEIDQVNVSKKRRVRKWMPIFEWKKTRNSSSSSRANLKKMKYYIASFFVKWVRATNVKDKSIIKETLTDFFSREGWLTYDIVRYPRNVRF